MNIRLGCYALLTMIAMLPLEYLTAQQVFDRKITSQNNIGLAITNVGTIGKPDVRSNPSGDPSFEFPLNSGQEHLFEAGFWIGVKVGGAVLLSSSAVTNPTGYSTGRSGYEFTNDGTTITERSSLPESPLFSPLAVSHQDFITSFSDKRTAIETGGASITINNHTQPLYVDVALKSYSWNFAFTESFSILEYTFTNNSDETWNDVYIGLYADLVNRNVNSALETGGAFFNKNGIGYLDSLYTTYVFDAGSADNPSLNTYAGVSLMGADYRGSLFHDSNKDYLADNGMDAPKVGPNYWLFSAGTGVFVSPSDDNERYNKMVNVFPYEDNAEPLRTDGQTSNGNYISFISIGSFPEVLPEESFKVYFSFVGGLKPQDYQTLAHKKTDTEATRVDFIENIGWAYRTFYGEDANRNGVLDADEDINQNGVLDRFLIPEPPASPKLRVELDAGKVKLYWDKRAEDSIDPISREKDFEGYKIYKTRLGADLNGTITSVSEVIAEFDSTGNDIGFNTGFTDIELQIPMVFDDEPGTNYYYEYEVGNLLSGWQYQFAVTAFDNGGGESLEIGILESSRNANAVRVFPGTQVNTEFSDGTKKVGVYPNPYRVNAAWDGTNNLTRKVIFYNLPSRAEVRVYTLAGEIVATLQHDSDSYKGDIRWFNDFSADNRIAAGGEHAWDLLSTSNQNLSTGLYLYTVKDKDSGSIQRGKLAIIK